MEFLFWISYIQRYFLFLENCAVEIVEMLYTNRILAITGINESSMISPKRLTIWNTTSSIPLCEISFNSQIIFV